MKPSHRAWFDRHRQVNTWLPIRDHERLLRLAEREGETPSAVVRSIIERALADDAERTADLLHGDRK